MLVEGKGALTEEHPDQDDPEAASEDETDGETEPEGPLPEPVLKGEKGIETAQVWFCAFLILVAGVIAYCAVLGIPFHAEDQRIIRDNTALHSLTTFPEALDPNMPRPLTMLTFYLNWAVAPDNSPAFHAVNLFLHLLNGILVYMLCRFLLGKPVREPIAMLAGLLFVLHPLNTESVDYVVGRSGILATCFALASVLLFLRATRDQELRVGELALSVIAFVFAWLCEETALILPAIVLATDYVLRGGRGFHKRLVIHGPYWGMLVILVTVHVAATGASPLGAPNTAAFLEYLRMTVAAYGLSVVHMAPESSSLGLAAVAAPALIGLFLLWRRSLAGLALCWFSLGILVASAADPPLVERRAYLALAGFVILLPWAVSLGPRPSLRVAAGLASAALLVAAGGATYARNTVWQGEVSLWSDASQKAPNSPYAARCLGKAVLDIGGDAPGQAEVAVNQFRRAIELDPDDASARVYLGIALRRAGRVDEALDAWRDALKLDLDNRECTLLIADALSGKAARARKRDLLLSAREYYKRAEQLKPLTGPQLERYAMALLSVGDIEAAAPLLARAVAGNPGSPVVPVLDNVRATLKRLRDMEQQAAVLSAKDASDPAARRLRAQICMVRGQAVQAAYILDGILREGAEDFAAWVLLGSAKARMENGVERFLEEWPAPLPKPEQAGNPWHELARACAASGLWDAAERYLASPDAGSEEVPRLLALADIALGLRQARQAYDYLNRATEAYPEDPAPWLRLCDLALGGKDLAGAQRYFAEARTRGADPAELTKRKERLGGTPPGNGQSAPMKILSR